jgi:hypothetical protein
VSSSRAAEQHRLGALRARLRTYVPRGRGTLRAALLGCACVLALLISVGPAQARTTYFRSVSSAVTASASSIVLSAPSGMSVGDLLILNVDAKRRENGFQRAVRVDQLDRKRKTTRATRWAVGTRSSRISPCHYGRSRSRLIHGRPRHHPCGRCADRGLRGCQDERTV